MYMHCSIGRMIVRVCNYGKFSKLSFSKIVSICDGGLEALSEIFERYSKRKKKGCELLRNLLLDECVELMMYI